MPIYKPYPPINTEFIGTRQQVFHHGLDVILEASEKVHGRGGETTITDDNGTVWKVSICEYTNEKPCAFCNGTGIEGS